MFRRYASSKPFQWPTTPNPSPHQIFHLPRNASQQDIKQRYFDLVRIYHPDKVEHSIASEIAHARFQAITAAYASLRGVSSDSQDAPPSPTARNLYKRNRRLYTAPPFSDERWKDRIIVSGVLLAAFCFVIHSASMRRDLMLEAAPTTPGLPSKMAPMEEARLADPD